MNAASKPHPTSMRAILQSGYGGTEVLRLGTRERPLPREGEVLIEVAAAGLDRGTWHLMTGRPYLMRLMGFGFLRPNNPVPGLDVAGTVVAVGPNVSRFSVGDAVFGIGEGSFAEYTRARVDKLARKPTRLGFEQAAILGISGMTALQALRDAGRVEAGERVLIVGASGGVGTFAVQIAKALGADVTGVARTDTLELVRSIGADDVIDYTARDFADGARQYDVILDIGGNTPLARIRRALTAKGRLVFVGGENGGDITAGFGRQLMALALGAFVEQRFAMLMCREDGADLERLAALVDEGKITPVLDRAWPLEAVARAMRDLESGMIRGKVAIVPGFRAEEASAMNSEDLKTA